jgi:hypothetical protein
MFYIGPEFVEALFSKERQQTSEKTPAASQSTTTCNSSFEFGSLFHAVMLSLGLPVPFLSWFYDIAFRKLEGDMGEKP